jgi:hypothetical protein
VPPHHIYSLKELARELRQGEIISDLAQFVPDATQARDEQGNVRGEFVTHSFAVVVSQDCDLLRDFDERAEGKEGALASVLLYAAQAADEVQADVKSSQLWKRIAQNNNERYHLLEKIGQACDLRGQGIESLVIDFRWFFTLTPLDIYKQIEAGTAKRRCRLDMPYREHLQCRAAFYFQRVMLPVPHKWEKEQA